MNKKPKLKRGDNQLDAVSPDDMQEALRIASLWLTDKLEGRTERGPFSASFLGEPARLYFPKHAYVALKSGNWKWKKGLKLSTQLIRIMKSEMSHSIRDWNAKGKPNVSVVSSFERKEDGEDEAKNPNGLSEVDPEQRSNGFFVKSSLELAEELEAQTQALEMGYKIALEVAKDHPKLTLYVQLVRKLNNYRAIALKMHITMQEVRNLEAELLSRLKK